MRALSWHALQPLAEGQRFTDAVPHRGKEIFMIRSKACARWLLPALGLVLGAAACAGQDTIAAETADVAVSGGGVTVDVVTTNVWNTGFNGAVRITNTAFPSPITSFEIV